MNPLIRIVELVESSRAAERLADAMADLLPPIGDESPLRKAPLGHATHPVLTDLPLGCWTSAMLLDLLGGAGSRRAATLLVALGVASAVPTALTGYADWGTLEGTERRVGAVHALVNVAGLALFTGSLVDRLIRREREGRRLALVGGVAVAAAGHL
ncbi:MAG: DUF2231 domain-containing protein, partial [Nocardioidaceae bacterium]